MNLFNRKAAIAAEEPIAMEEPYNLVIQFLLGKTYMTAEMQALGMALQGAMIVRMGPNKTNRLHWFHAFILSVMFAFAGGLMGFVWLGKPSSMLSSGDVNLGSCILAFVLVNYTPFDIGFTVLSTLPMIITYTSIAQLFRATGIMRFVAACFNEFKHAPSPYYPIPVLGPILYATLLGNMGGFFMKGVEGHVMNGMPWPIQNGIFCASFYHFYVNDETGIVGTTLRQLCMPIVKVLGITDEAVFAGLVVSIFMQITGILQLPYFLGPQFSPFGTTILTPLLDASTWALGKRETEYSKLQREEQEEAEPPKTTRKSKSKKKKES